MPRRILFLVPYPIGESPSQRYRFEQYFKLLHENKIQYSVQSFLNARNWRLTFQHGFLFSKIVAVSLGFVKRVIALSRASFYDFVFIHREVTPLGSPVFEWILGNLLRKKIIYDFDDAIWLSDGTQEAPILTFLKCRSKVRSICSWSYKVSCGNEFLRSYASHYCPGAVYNPTTIDTVHWHNPDLHRNRARTLDKVTIGWTGSHSTLKYLKLVEPVLQEIERTFPAVSTVIIADKKPDLKLDRMIFIPWNIETEISDLMQLDIGIMPLPDDDWAKGKCGFKALQYMALNIPAVTSPVGVNLRIINNGVDGYLCSTEDDWKKTLTSLILDSSLRNKIGRNGRNKVIESYSVLSNSSNFLSLFE